MAAALQRRGWQILLRNWQDRYAEVDLVALSPEGGLHVIEVKTRGVNIQGRFDLQESLRPTQLRRLRRAIPRLWDALPPHIFGQSWHIDAAFVTLGEHSARIVFLPDCHDGAS